MLIQILFLFLLCSFYIIYFVKMLLLKRQGITGNLLGKGEKPKKAARFEMCLEIITWIGAVTQFISAAFPQFIRSFSAALPVQIIGVVLGFSGIIFFLLSIMTMRSNWRAGFDSRQETELVTGGIYKISRNPAFVGFDFLYIGCALAFPNIISIIASLMAVIAFHIQILGEEKFLAAAFGREYHDYKSKVGR